MAKITKIKKILIANRGEIAVRIMRTCRDLGIKTVAVYSEADRAARHVQMADEAYFIGPSPAIESYLVIDNIMQAAIKSHADAIHPGYGFLSEKAAFSQACIDAGIIFLGPGPLAIEKMGDKIAARKIAEAAKIPMIPGLKSPLKDIAEAKKLALEYKYPVLLKASAGGGGKGMRAVHKEQDMEKMFQMAASEAKKAFNDDRLYLEKYLPHARHVEIQILCDKHGNGVHLFERECSLQRRHQKVIEEAPFWLLQPETRDKMTHAALRLAGEVDYVGVGTVEFLLDEEQNFYFLEMNTRLQVEHPVSEMITGLDLVQLQIEVGEGRPLSLKQKDIQAQGCAIECRLYAEDPENNFFPSPGTIEWMCLPAGPGVRHDSGVLEGTLIPIYYDPLIAKLITWGRDRSQAIARMQRALMEYEIGGFKNNISFLRTILEHPDYLAGKTYTLFIEDHPELMKKRAVDLPQAWVFGLAAFDREQMRKNKMGQGKVVEESPWKLLGRKDALGQR